VYGTKQMKLAAKFWNLQTMNEKDVAIYIL